MKKVIVRPKPLIGFMPIGKTDNAGLKLDYTRGARMIQSIEADIVETPPLWRQTDVMDWIYHMNSMDIDILILYVLHGMSAEQQVLAGRKCHAPLVIWSLPDNYSFSSCASAGGALKERNVSVKMIHATSRADTSVLKDIASCCRVGYAVNQLKKCRIGVIGGIFPNLPADQYNRTLLEDKFGAQIVHVSADHCRRYLDKTGNTRADISTTMKLLKKQFHVTVDEALLENAIQLHLALNALARDERFFAIALECHTELTPLFGVNPCLGLADKNSRYVPLCEGDVQGGINMLISRFLTDSAAYIGDTLSVKHGILSLAHCGAHCGWAPDESVAIVERQAPSHLGKKTSMAVCMPDIPLQKATLTRLYGNNADKMHCAACDIVKCDTAGVLKVELKLEDPHSFLDCMSGNHYSIARGDIREQIKLFCAWKKISYHESNGVKK